MIDVCQEYGAVHNLQFSTDPSPARSKTKSVLFCGKKSVKKYPAPVVLNGEELPWVEKFDQLGHSLHQSLSMEDDAVRARACFMNRASDVRDQFYFGTAEQRMKAIQLYCCDNYGSMLLRFEAEYSQKYFRSWNIQARLVWGIPYSYIFDRRILL